MTGETIVDKAGRLLVTGRVRVLQAADGRAVVLVRGDHGRYVVECDGTAWRCDCPARVAGCSHVTAAALVTGPEPTVGAR